MSGQLGIVIGKLRVVSLRENGDGSGSVWLAPTWGDSLADQRLQWEVGTEQLSRITIGTSLWVEAPVSLFADD